MKQLPILDWLLTGVGDEIVYKGKNVYFTYLYRLLLDDDVPKEQKLSAYVLQTYLPSEFDISIGTLGRLVKAVRDGDYDGYIKFKSKESGIEISKLMPPKSKRYQSSGD